MTDTKKLLLMAGVMMLSGLVMGYHGSVSWTHAILIASLLAFLIKFGLALWIYMLNPSANVNRTFAIVFTGQAVWDLGKFLMWLTNDSGYAMMWAKISYSGYIISVFFLLSFVWAYLKKKNYFTTVPGRIVLYTPMVFLLAALWAGKGVISGLIPPDALHFGFGIELWDYTYGPVYKYFFMWFQIIPFIYAFIYFVLKYFQSQREDKKKQIFYLMLGSAFPIMLGIPTGVVLPAMGIYLPPHNNVLSLIMSVFIAVGIIKYKFLAIQPIGEKIIPGRKLEHELAKRYKMDPGHSHFIKHEKSSEIAYSVLLTHLYQSKYGLIITAHNPAKIRHEHGIETTPVVWMTDTETEHLSVDPIDLEQIYETIKRFIEKVPNAYVLIDGVDYLLQHNNFTKVLHFIKQVKGMLAKSDDCLIVPKGSLVLDTKQQKLLEAEFLVLPKAAAESKESERGAAGAKKTNYIIIGHNPLAQSVISEFEKRSIKPVVVEKKDVLVHYPKGAVEIIRGDPLSTKVLMHAGISKPNTTVLVTLENDSDIILCINKIRQISDTVRIITNINNQNFVSIAMKAGADNVIPSSSIGGRLISLALSSPDIVRWVMDATTLAAKELELYEFVVDTKSRIVGKTVAQVDRHMGKSANIIAVKTVEGLKQIPDDDYILKEGDRLVLIVNMETLPRGKEMAERVGKLVKQAK